MSNFEGTEEEQYIVVVNIEEQYSVWLVDRPLPAGWRAAEMAGSKADCLAYIDRVWTDMRPRSLRDASAQSAFDPHLGQAEGS